MRHWISLLRVTDYIKNILVFFPAFFAGKILAADNFSRSGILFILFSFLCSGVYIINDLFDQRWDARHPTKRHKPLTSGIISWWPALASATLLLLLAMIPAYLLAMQIFWLFAVYLIINLFYSAFGKHVPFLDLLIIAFGFLLRLQAGGIATSVPISAWLYVTIVLFALGFGLAKRLEEIRLLSQHGVDSANVRPALKFYAESFARPGIIGIVLIAGACYMAYTLNAETMQRLGSPFVFVTCLPVIVGIYNYIKLVQAGQQSIMPQQVLLQNRPIQISLLCWIVLMAYFIYL
ncbi:MAG TPA: UbiA prenyltransferase family protein [Chitinophagales bacterium]|nr:UbiA prenyltransferase family protein [Chitinophagales bacterium]